MKNVLINIKLLVTNVQNFIGCGINSRIDVKYIVLKEIIVTVDGLESMSLLQFQLQLQMKISVTAKNAIQIVNGAKIQQLTVLDARITLLC